MNNIFHAKRFRRLLKKTVFERPMQTFGLTGLLLILSLILYSIIKILGGFLPGTEHHLYMGACRWRLLFGFLCIRLFLFQCYGFLVSYLADI